MSGIGLPPAARLAMALVLVAAPTVLFLLFWRGLRRLRDDSLVDRALNRYGAGGTSPRAGTDAGGPVRPEQSAPRWPPGGEPPTAALDLDAEETVECGACGAKNAAGYRVCHNCLGRLEE